MAKQVFDVIIAARFTNTAKNQSVEKTVSTFVIAESRNLAEEKARGEDMVRKLLCTYVPIQCRDVAKVEILGVAFKNDTRTAE